MTIVRARTSTVKPSITSAIDGSSNPIPNGGSTSDSSITLNGTAEANSVVVIYDGTAFKGSASVVSAGTWAKSISDLAAETHRFTARTGDGTLISDEWVITVGASLDLIAPTVAGATGGVLDPMQAIAGAKVVVAYAGMNTTDSIALSWDGQLDVAPPQYGSNLGSVTFDIPVWAVGTVIGKTINVLYVVARNGVSTLSDTLMLQVANLPESALEAPKIAQAPDDQNLDVSVLTADADLSVKPWPFINAGQRISLRFEGTKADGTPYNWSHPTWQDLPLSSTAMPSTNVGLSDLKALKSGSSLKLIFEVSSDDGSTKLRFPDRTLNVTTVVSYFEDFEAEQPRTLPNGSHTFPSGLLLQVLGSVAAIQVREESNGERHRFLTGIFLTFTMSFGMLPRKINISLNGGDPGIPYPGSVTLHFDDTTQKKFPIAGPMSYASNYPIKEVVIDCGPAPVEIYDIGWE
jgi:hypothetical protein